MFTCTVFCMNLNSKIYSAVTTVDLLILNCCILHNEQNADTEDIRRYILV